MSHAKIWDEASEVAAEEGEVIVDGPNGVAVSLTPDAALETSERLLAGGLAARGQQIADEGNGSANGRQRPAVPREGINPAE
jgi:hypothetical protein